MTDPIIEILEHSRAIQRLVVDHLETRPAAAGHAPREGSDHSAHTDDPPAAPPAGWLRIVAVDPCPDVSWKSRVQVRKDGGVPWVTAKNADGKLVADAEMNDMIRGDFYMDKDWLTVKNVEIRKDGA